MSDRFGLKVKENAGKTKYSSLNLNQTYKGTKVETKTSSGAARHGLQSLGKVGASRRIPPPANLPSLKSENSGNDPTVSLVPSGGGGWGSAKEKPPEGTQGAPQPAPPSSTPQQTNVPSTQQPLLQPQRPVPPPSHPQPPQTQSQNSGQSQTQPVKQQQSQVKTWGSVSSNGAGGSGRTYSQQEMPYFNREFPVLGVGNSGERMPPNMEEKDFAQYGPRPVIRNTHEPAWMERSASGPQPSDYNAARERPEVYNGGPGPGYTGGPHYRRPPDYQHLPHGKSHSLGYPPHHHGNGPHGYGPGPGRPLHGNPPDYATRGPVHKPGAATGPGHPSKLYEGRGEGYGRPAILKPEDIQAMADNDEEEEGGWAGVQDEVDYAAKLDFEDFEEEDKPPAEPGREKSDRDRSNNEVDSRWQSSEGKSVKETGPSVARTVSSEAQGHPHHYADGRQVPSSPGMQPFDSKGSPPASGWPMPYSKQIPAGQRGGGPPQQAPLDQGKPSSKEEPVVNEWQKRREKQQEEMRAAVERARKRREEEELKRQLEQKAASHAKLKELEQKRARRESGKEGDDAWAEELDFIEKDVHIKEPVTDEMGAESLERVQEPQNTAVDQHDNAMLRTDNSERLNRVRNDSDSSDASRSSSSRGTSRPHHHPRDIPPRFQQQQQQQQLRQQQQQHIQSNYYHQQQPYPHQYQTHHQQLSRSSHQREFQEGPLSVSSHPVVDSGPVSPSQAVKPDLPVKRIMKRSDSSSTAGDDISSVKSLESATGEPAREIEKRSSAAPEQQTIENTEVIGEQTKEQSFEAVNLKGKTQDDLDLPVFEEDGIVDSRDERQQQQQEAEKPRVSESEKERVISKEKLPEKKERKESREAARKPPPEKMPQIKDRREDRREDRRDDRRGTKRDTRPYERRRNDDSKDLGKRKRDDNDEGGYVPERRGRFAGRDDSKRDRFPEFRGRGRVSFPVRGLGRGMGASATSYRGRGRGERGVRDYREPKPFRSREPKPLSPAKSLDGEQKPAQEDKENVAAKENSSIPENDATEKEEKIVVVVKQLDIEDGLLRPEKELVTGKEDEGVDKEKKDVILKQENKEGESKDSTSRLADNDADTVSRQDPRKRQDNNRETDNLKPKGRGGFGKPSQYSDDSRRISYDDKRPSGKTFPDRRRPYNDKGRDRGEDHENKRFSRNYNKDQTSQRSAGRENRNKDRGREKEQKVYSNYDRDAVNRRYSQDDRKKRLGEKDDEQQYSRPRGDERNQRGGYRSSYSTRGRFSKPPVRPSTRGGRSSQPVASGQFGNNYRRSKSTDEELSEDDYESDSSSYTTATSASEERRDDKTSDKETDPKKGRESSSGFAKKTMPSSRSARSPLRGKVASRAGPRGTGGFGRSRREVERPPRFQKQQERERASFTRGVSRGDRHNEGGENRPGRGRGRGRGRKDQLPLNSSVIPVTEDWDQEVGSSVKEEESSRNEKLETRKESISRKGFSSSRPFSDRTRKDKGRESGGAPNTSSRREPFLVERQQAKVEGSKFTGGEPRVPLPAARNGFSKDGNRRSDVQSGPHSTGLDSINTGSSESSKVGRQQDPTSRKTDIQQFDLHNIAGVICIDDMTDDDSDISSTLSGFVEVTSRRTQKENKERQREEEERRKKTDEQIRQRSNQTGNKKGQSTKPPRFSKQHSPQVNTQSKAVGVIGKSVHGALSEAVAGLANTTSNSNASSASSTKRNSPITVERPVSPAPPPVFNAWDKPLNIVTPAKPPSASPQVITTVPDPLAVGSGKPSSTRSAQSGTVMPTVPPSLIEDASVEEDYIAMTKEIALLAPPEEPDESEEPSQTVNSTKPKVGIADQTSEVSKDASEKRTQSKPQREKPPRFDRISKRKVAAANSEETKKETYAGGKGRKSSRENLGPQNQQAKASADNNPKRKNQTQSSTQQPPSAAEDEIPDGLKSTQDVLESKDHDVSARATASDEGSDEKDALKESEGQEGKDDSESESSRKDSEPDLNVDSSERNSDGDNLFTASSLTVDIHERSTGERPAREPSPVSPAIFEMSMKMEASRKLWENGLEIRRPGNPVTAWEETLRTPSVSSSIVGMPVVESPDLRLSDDQVAVSKPQADIDVNPSKPDSKSTDGMNFNKKPGTGEQQNVCKVKPQQQQQPSVKPQQSNPVVAQTPEESRPNELNTVPLTQPLLTQEQLLAHQAMPQRYAFPFVSPLMDLQQRQPFLRQPQIQQLQEANQQVTPTFPITHVQEVNQTRASSSPLSQAAQDIYQSSFLASGVYSAGTFQGAQPFVSIALLPSTTTQSYATSTPTTQTASLMGMHTQQQAKTASGTVFPQNVNPQGGQTMYVPFDPKSLSGGTPLFNLTQHPPSAQRHLLGGQPGLVGDNVPRQGGFPTPPPGHQPFQGTYSFHQKQAAYDVSQDMQINQKSPEQTAFNRQSELVKHVNAKPFEPPKRSTPGTGSSGSAPIGPLVSSAFTRNPNMMAIRPSPPDAGGPSQSPPVSTSILSGRPVSVSPVDPGVPFPGAVGTFPKHPAISQFQVQQQPQGVQPQQFTPFQQQAVGIQHALQIRPQGQQQQQTVNSLPGATAAILPNPAVLAATIPRQLVRAPGLGAIGLGGPQPSPNAQRFPAPIQRPMAASLMHGMHHMQAPRGPRPQSAPPQMIPAKQQAPSSRPQMLQGALPPQDPMAAAFKYEQHHKMMEQTRMFFAQQGHQQQHRVPQQNISDEQQLKAVTSLQGDKANVKAPALRETNKLQDKKDEVTSRNKKPSSEQANKTSKTTKVDSKPDESNKDKNSKQDGKIAVAKSVGSGSTGSGVVRIQPLHMHSRSKPNRPRGPPRMPGMPPNKAKLSGRPEKEVKDASTSEHPGESQSPRNSDQAKASDVQSVSPLGVNQG